jgi:hypothetical protein
VCRKPFCELATVATLHTAAVARTNERIAHVFRDATDHLASAGAGQRATTTPPHLATAAGPERRLLCLCLRGRRPLVCCPSRRLRHTRTHKLRQQRLQAFRAASVGIDERATTPPVVGACKCVCVQLPGKKVTDHSGSPRTSRRAASRRTTDLISSTGQRTHCLHARPSSSSRRLCLSIADRQVTLYLFRSHPARQLAHAHCNHRKLTSTEDDSLSAFSPFPVCGYRPTTCCAPAQCLPPTSCLSPFD